MVLMVVAVYLMAEIRSRQFIDLVVGLFVIGHSLGSWSVRGWYTGGG